MDNTSIKKLIAVMISAYPNHFKSYTTADIDNLVMAWGMVLEDYTYEQASNGLKVFMRSDTKGFPPSPGQVVDCILKVYQPPDNNLSADEVWYKVVKATENSLYNSESEFEKLPEIAKKIIVTPARLRELALTDGDTLHSVEKSLFFRSFRAQIEREKENAKIPQSIKSLVSFTAAKIGMN